VAANVDTGSTLFTKANMNGAMERALLCPNGGKMETPYTGPHMQ